MKNTDIVLSRSLTIMSNFSLFSKERDRHEYLLRKKCSVFRNGKMSKKKKSEIYTLQDGYLSINVTLSPELKCQCGGILCDHIILVLIKLFNASPLLTGYLGEVEIQKYLCDSINRGDDKITIKVEAEIYRYFSTIDCPSCLNSLSTQIPHLFQCHNCKKFTHSSCFEKWASPTKRNPEIKGCMLCRAIVS